MSQGTKYCHKCGAPLPASSVFCPNCGSSVPSAIPVSGAAPAVGQPQTQPPAQPEYYGRHRHNEKQEKQEKHEKNEKNEKHEKGRGGDLAGALTGGLILILLGLLFYLAQSNLLSITWSNWWAYLLVGIGVILIIQGIIRYGQHGYLFQGSFIGGAILIIIGLAFVSNWGAYFWPLVLVILGVAAIVSALVGRRRTPAP
jgi:cation transport ATPase